MVFTKKKSYNCFKMWGAWLGATLLFLIAPSIIDLSKNYTSFVFLDYLIDKFIELFFLVLGFLLGWFIHCIFRFFKNRKRE